MVRSSLCSVSPTKSATAWVICLMRVCGSGDVFCSTSLIRSLPNIWHWAFSASSRPSVYRKSVVPGSRALGEQDNQQVNRTFMVNLAGGLLFSLAVALPITLFAPSFVSLYTDNVRLYPLAIEYLPVAPFIGVAFAIQNSYTVFLQLCGKASLVVRVTIAQMVINLLADLLFIVVFGWGLQGAVFATICSYLLSLVMIVPVASKHIVPDSMCSAPCVFILSYILSVILLNRLSQHYLFYYQFLLL